jgi:hypothetical protein
MLLLENQIHKKESSSYMPCPHQHPLRKAACGFSPSLQK